MKIKLATYNDLGDCEREDVNQLISALVRVGYGVSLMDDYICFTLGNDDILEEENNGLQTY
jgi:hypothetical protein